MNILVTGANGFVGKAFIKSLLDDGHEVTALVRDLTSITKLKCIKWIQGDLLLPHTLPELETIDKAFYLVHGLKESDDQFEYHEAMCAVNFVNWIRRTNAGIVYLGGIAPENRNLSPHLRSRVLTGAILGASGLSVIELRASIILGEGSISFEMIKALAERFPMRPELSFLNQKCSPLALVDLISYLKATLSTKVIGHQIFEIGASSAISYGGLIDLYSKLAGLRRLRLKLPDIDRKIVMKVLDYAIPEFSQIGKKLADSLEFPTEVKSNLASEFFENIKPLSIEEAMKMALQKSQTKYAQIWDKEFIKFLVSEKILTQSMPDVLLKLEKVANLRQRLLK